MHTGQGDAALDPHAGHRTPLSRHVSESAATNCRGQITRSSARVWGPEWFAALALRVLGSTSTPAEKTVGGVKNGASDPTW